MAYEKKGPILTQSKCASCGKGFEYLSVRRPRTYCSPQCYPAYRLRKRRGEPKPPYAKRGPVSRTANCSTCGVVFEYLWVRKPKKYCSIKCRPSLTPRPCDKCGKIIARLDRKNICHACSYAEQPKVRKQCDDCGRPIYPKLSNSRATKLCRHCVIARAHEALKNLPKAYVHCVSCGQPLPYGRPASTKWCNQNCRARTTDRIERRDLHHTYIKMRLTRRGALRHFPWRDIPIELIAAYRAHLRVLREIKQRRER